MTIGRSGAQVSRRAAEEWPPAARPAVDALAEITRRLHALPVSDCPFDRRLTLSVAEAERASPRREERSAWTDVRPGSTAVGCHAGAVTEGREARESLSEELISLGASEPSPPEHRVLRWREFSLGRWAGVALVMLGVSLTAAWWVGLPLALLGALLLMIDNGRVRRDDAR